MSKLFWIYAFYLSVILLSDQDCLIYSIIIYLILNGSPTRNAGPTAQTDCQWIVRPKHRPLPQVGAADNCAKQQLNKWRMPHSTSTRHLTLHLQQQSSGHSCRILPLKCTWLVSQMLRKATPCIRLTSVGLWGDDREAKRCELGAVNTGWPRVLASKAAVWEWKYIREGSQLWAALCAGLQTGTGCIVHWKL